MKKYTFVFISTDWYSSLFLTVKFLSVVGNAYCRGTFCSLWKIKNCEYLALTVISISTPPASQLREHGVSGAERMVRAGGDVGRLFFLDCQSQISDTET